MEDIVVTKYVDKHILEEFAGPQLLGAVWNWLLYGILVVQFYVYSRCFPRDNKYIKLLGTRIPHLIPICFSLTKHFVVYSIFVLETFQTVLSGADLYFWFIAGFNDFINLAFVTPFAAFFDLQIVGSMVSLSVQLFFVYRIRVLSRLCEKRSRWLCIIICLLSVTGTIGAFTAGIILRITNVFIEGSLQKIFQITWFIANTLADLLIASAMIYYLRRVWAKDAFLKNHVLVKIVRLTVETNLATTTVSLVSLIMIAAYPHKIYYLCPTYLIGKLYSNSLLVSLNNRILIRDTYEARGGVIDCEVVTVPAAAARSEATRDTIILEAVKPQDSEDLMPVKQPIAETEVEERMNSPEIVDA